MEKRILKNGVEEMSENLKNRIMKITQDMLNYDKEKEGELFRLEYKGPQFTVDLFNTVLTKVAEEFHVEVEEENRTTIDDIMIHLQMENAPITIEEEENGKR
jgi:hypothetical protein|tara:strand:+ start:216 stop:521 length:306 start_codon:yes stop_codon:yes gene_type:complete